MESDDVMGITNYTDIGVQVSGATGSGEDTWSVQVHGLCTCVCLQLQIVVPTVEQPPASAEVTPSTSTSGSSPAGGV
jgi:hypothetical protein